MRFLDANVFIYAYYKPKRELTEKQKQMKERSKEIIIYSFDKGFGEVLWIKRVP